MTPKAKNKKGGATRWIQKLVYRNWLFSKKA